MADPDVLPAPMRAWLLIVDHAKVRARGGLAYRSVARSALVHWCRPRALLTFRELLFSETPIHPRESLCVRTGEKGRFGLLRTY